MLNEISWLGVSLLFMGFIGAVSIRTDRMGPVCRLYPMDVLR